MTAKKTTPAAKTAKAKKAAPAAKAKLPANVKKVAEVKAKAITAIPSAKPKTEVKAEKPKKVHPFKGKKITAIIAENPRGKTSYGFKAFQIILDNPGILYEDFLKKGGRYEDLKWDLERDRVELSD